MAAVPDPRRGAGWQHDRGRRGYWGHGSGAGDPGENSAVDDSGGGNGGDARAADLGLLSADPECIPGAGDVAAGVCLLGVSIAPGPGRGSTGHPDTNGEVG